MCAPSDVVQLKMDVLLECVPVTSLLSELQSNRKARDSAYSLVLAMATQLRLQDDKDSAGGSHVHGGGIWPGATAQGAGMWAEQHAGGASAPGAGFVARDGAFADGMDESHSPAAALPRFFKFFSQVCPVPLPRACAALSCHAVPCHTISCHVMSCHVLSR